MRRWTALTLIALVGCGLFPSVMPPIPAGTRVIGGIGDARPYFGTLHRPDGLVVGEFLLATCGCGEWRVLLDQAEDDQRTQFACEFYSNGEYDTSQDVTVAGMENDDWVYGVVVQALGRTEGRARAFATDLRFTAQRGENHTDDDRACVKCHVGEDPVWPQPEGHPPFELDPPNCLACHTVTIDP